MRQLGAKRRFHAPQLVDGCLESGRPLLDRVPSGQDSEPDRRKPPPPVTELL